jgi:hypothetical protein
VAQRTVPASILEQALDGPDAVAGQRGVSNGKRELMV